MLLQPKIVQDADLTVNVFTLHVHLSFASKLQQR